MKRGDDIGLNCGNFSAIAHIYCMSEQLSNNAVSSLVAAISSSDTTIQVHDASSFPTQGTFTVRVDDEGMTVNSVSGSNFTVQRAEFGASVAHAANASVVAVVSERVLTDFIAENAGGLTAVVADTSPSLGGNLTLNGHNIGGVTPTTLGYLDATSSIQTQINAKQATITGGASSIVSSNLTAGKALQSDSSGKVQTSSVTNTELGYVSGVTSAIQTQINSKTGPENIATVLTNGNDAGGASVLGVNEIGLVAVANPAIGVNGMLIIDTQTGTDLEIGCLAFARNSGVGASHVVIGGANNSSYGLGAGSQVVDIASLYGNSSGIPFAINIGFHAANSNSSTVTINGITYPATDGTANQVLSTNGSHVLGWVDQPAPGGSDTQIQFNDSGTFAGDANLIWDGTTLTVNGVAYPTADGNAGQVISTDGNGMLSFVDATATAGGTSGQIQVNSGGVLGGLSGLTFDGTTLTSPRFVPGEAYYGMPGSNSQLLYNKGGLMDAAAGITTNSGGEGTDLAVSASITAGTYIGATTSVSAGTNVGATLDVTSGRDVISSRDVTATRNLSASNFSGTSSGTNSGDQDLSSYATTAAVAATYATLANNSGVNSGDQDLSSYATSAAVAAGYVPLAQTVNGHALSGPVTVTDTDVGTGFTGTQSVMLSDGVTTVTNTYVNGRLQ
jgi:hypothetical protein